MSQHYYLKVAIGLDKKALSKPIDMISKARRPIILAGLGIYWDKASAELIAFAEQLGAPVLTTSKCKGVIPEDQNTQLHRRWSINASL